MIYKIDQRGIFLTGVIQIAYDTFMKACESRVSRIPDKNLYAINYDIYWVYSTGLAIKWLRILSLGDNHKIRNHLVANVLLLRQA